MGRPARIPVISRYVGEGMRIEDHPGIVFRSVTPGHLDEFFRLKDEGDGPVDIGRLLQARSSSNGALCVCWRRGSANQGRHRPWTATS